MKVPERVREILAALLVPSVVIGGSVLIARLDNSDSAILLFLALCLFIVYLMIKDSLR